MAWGCSPIPNFRFADEKDIGVTLYLLLVSAWFFFHLPIVVLAPVFFADPAGAVCGKYVSRNWPEYNKAWFEKKTVVGSFAVFTFTFLTIQYVCTVPERAGVAVLAMLAEAFGGAYDNLALAAVVLAGWQTCAWLH